MSHHHEPTPIERLFLWRLAAAGGGDFNKNIRPSLPKTGGKKARPNRISLAEAKLITETSRKPENTGRGIAYIELTDQGWGWLSQQKTNELPPRSNNAETLQLLLTRLYEHLTRQNLSLAEFLTAPPSAGESSQTPETDSDRSAIETPVSPKSHNTHAELKTMIETAFMEISEAKNSERVHLADLREALPQVDRPQLDAALLEMVDKKQISLFRLDNPREIFNRDRAAALYTEGGAERHIMSIGESFE